MARPSFLTNLPPYVRSISKPAVWAPLAIATLLGIFAWEYSQNPERFDREQILNRNPDSGLTAEEQAKLSEIDTLELLLEQTKLPEGTPQATSRINPDAPDSVLDPDVLDGVLNTDLSGEAALPDSRQLSGREDPFAPYAADYEFPGARVAAGNATLNPVGSSSLGSAGTGIGNPSATPSTTRATSSGESFNFGNGLINPAAPATNSALSEALGRQQAAKAAEEAQQNGGRQPSLAESEEGIGTNVQTSGTGSINQQPAGVPTRVPIGQASSAAEQSASQPITPTSSGQPSFQPAAPSGTLSVPFTRTTPNMSPPVGTTGYTAPATSNLPIFNRPQTQPTRNPFSAAPATPAAPPANTQPDTLYTAPSSIQPAQNRQRR
ncbi:MAG: hypothetical protein AAFV90_04360 [Cyanobacteria bacterium J06634_5]